MCRLFLLDSTNFCPKNSAAMHNKGLHERGDRQSMAVPYRHPLLKTRPALSRPFLWRWDLISVAQAIT